MRVNGTMAMVGVWFLGPCLASVPAGEAAAQGCFGTPAQQYDAGQLPYSVALGDIDGDGDLDLVVANELDDDVSVRRNTGSGSFGAEVRYPAGDNPVSVALGDVNGDGVLDMAVAASRDNGVSILLNAGNGTFGAPTGYACGTDPRCVALGDVDGDGDLDVAVANDDSSDASVLRNAGNGTFAPQVRYTAGNDPSSVALGDVNGDGTLDMAVGNWASGDVSIFLNTGNGAFGAQARYAAGGGPFSVALGDVDGDGEIDLAVANLTPAQQVSVLLNAGNGSFGAPSSYPAGFSPRGIALGDVNGDGDLDLAVANASDDVSILLNMGDGSFDVQVRYTAGTRPTCIVLGDVSGDGMLDIAVANSYSDDASVLLNNCDPPCPGSGPCIGQCEFQWTGAGGDLDFRNAANWSPDPGAGGPTGSVSIVNSDPGSPVRVEAWGGVLPMCELRLAGMPSGTGHTYDVTSSFAINNTTLDVGNDVQIDPYGGLTLDGFPGETSRLECLNLTATDHGWLVAQTLDPLFPANHEIGCSDLTVEPGGTFIVSGHTNLDVQCDAAAFGGELWLKGSTRATMIIGDSNVTNTGRIELGRFDEGLVDAELSMTAQLHNDAGAVFDGVAFTHVGDDGIFLAESTLDPWSLVNTDEGYIRTEGNSVINVGTMTNAGWLEVTSGTADLLGGIENVGFGQITIRPGATLRVQSFNGLDISVVGTLVEAGGAGAGAMAAAAGADPETQLVVASNVHLMHESRLDMESALMLVDGDLEIVHAGTLRMRNGSVVMRGAGRRLTVQDEARVELHDGTLRVEAWPVVVEAFSPDAGPGVSPAPVQAIGTIEVAEGAAMVFVDEHPNAGDYPNVVYAKNVIVRSGGVLDLNGGRLYYGTIEVETGGQIVNGELVPASFCVDLDGDGVVGFSELTQLLAAWGPCAGCPEDLDGDGDVGFTDLTTLLSKWGPCGS